jgi:hypothetical protein
MTTNTYALSRTERVWLLFSVTLLVSAAFYGVLAHRVVSVMDRPELTTCLQDFPVLLLISLSIGFFHRHRAVRLPSDPGRKTPGGDCMRHIRLKTFIRNQASGY